MSFQPSAKEQLVIDGEPYLIAEHPGAPGIPYGQEGRAATVYQLLASGSSEKLALKVFKPRFQVPAMVSLAERIEAFAELPGLKVCRRQVITARRNIDLVRQHPGLSYAVVMPWIEGPTWMEVLLSGNERADTFTPEASLTIARAMVEILAAMEERGVAHCDLSGPNVMLPALAESNKYLLASSGARRPAASSIIQLVDVEQMYGEELKRPEFVTSGSAGYGHRGSTEGLWSAKADRFSGALLIAEMLGWCDANVRQNSWQESYFDPGEIQAPESERYTLLMNVLAERWGADVARMLERAWNSDSLADCGTFGEWLAALPDRVPVGATVAPVQVAGQPKQPLVAQAHVQPPGPVTGAPSNGGGVPTLLREMLEEARKLEEEGDTAAALSTYREVRSMAAPGSGLAQELSLIIGQIEVARSKTAQPHAPQAAPSPPPPIPASTSRAATQQAAPQAPSQVEQTVASVVVPATATSVVNSPLAVSSSSAREAEVSSSASVAATPPAPPVRTEPQPVEQLPPRHDIPAPSSPPKPASKWNLGLVVPIILVALLLVFGLIALVLLQPRNQPGGVTTAPTNTVPASGLDGTAVPTEATGPTEQVAGGNLDKAFLTLSGHSSDVVSVAFAPPDGQTLASASVDKTIRLSKATDGSTITTLGALANPVFALAFSPDGKLLASGGAAGELKLWNIPEGTEARSFTAEAGVVSVAFSPDGKRLACGLENGQVTVWRLEDGVKLYTLDAHPRAVISIAFSPEGQSFFSGGDHASIKQWRVLDGSLVLTLDTPTMNTFALARDGVTIAVAEDTGQIELIDISGERPARKLEGQGGNVLSVAFTRDGATLASGSSDGSIKIWNVSDGKESQRIKAHGAEIKGLAFSPVERLLASGSGDTSVKLWQIP